MQVKQEIQPLKNGLCHYPFRTIRVFKTNHMTCILKKHIQETDADYHQKESTTEQWIECRFWMQIQEFTHVKLFIN